MESWNWNGGAFDYAWACFWYANLDVVSNTTNEIKH
jgi:hypothetical protein